MYLRQSRLSCGTTPYRMGRLGAVPGGSGSATLPPRARYAPAPVVRGGTGTGRIIRPKHGKPRVAYLRGLGFVLAPLDRAPVVRAPDSGGPVSTVQPEPIFSRAPVVYGGQGYGTLPSSGSPSVPFGSNGSNRSTGWRSWFSNQSTNQSTTPAGGLPSNPTGQPSTIDNYDAYGNPIYSVPPPGQVVVGYDQANNPIWGAPAGPTPTQAAGSVVSGAGGAGGITYDSLGTPLYSAVPAGYVYTGVDALGNPMYAPAGSAAALAAQATGEAAAVPTSALPATGDYQSVLDWFSESSLISGLPNWGVALGAAILLKVVSSGGGKKGGFL
jgi:hypothetical protein